MTGREKEAQDKACQCPYCDGPTEEPLPVCRLCAAAVQRCANCGKALTEGQVRCPGCGAEVKGTSGSL